MTFASPLFFSRLADGDLHVEQPNWSVSAAFAELGAAFWEAPHQFRADGTLPSIRSASSPHHKKGAGTQWRLPPHRRARRSSRPASGRGQRGRHGQTAFRRGLQPWWIPVAITEMDFCHRQLATRARRGWAAVRERDRGRVGGKHNRTTVTAARRLAQLRRSSVERRLHAVADARLGARTRTLHRCYAAPVFSWTLKPPQRRFPTMRPEDDEIRPDDHAAGVPLALAGETYALLHQALDARPYH